MKYLPLGVIPEVIPPVLEAPLIETTPQQVATDRAFVKYLAGRYGRYGLAAIGGREAVATRLGSEPDASGFALADSLGREVEDALRKPPAGPQ